MFNYLNGTLRTDRQGSTFVVKTQGLTASDITAYGFCGVRPVANNVFTVTAVDADDIKNALGGYVVSVTRQGR